MDKVQIIQCPICGEALDVGRLEWEKQYESERKEWINKAHKSFDAIWKSGIVERGLAYSWLAREMDIDYADCHFSNFSISECKHAYELCELVKARMLKAFCETTWGYGTRNASLANARRGTLSD